MRTVFRKLSAIVLTLMLAFLVLSPAVTRAEQATSVTVLHTNDIHCGIRNYEKVAAYKQSVTTPVTLIDLGDHIQGEIIGRLTQGQKIVEIMNAAGYDIAVPGNHEFDYQVPAFLNVIDAANYEYLSSNFKYADGSDVVTPNGKTMNSFKVVDYGGHKVGYVGIATPETYTKSTPTYFKDDQGNWVYTFNENNLYELVQKAIDGAKAAGAEVVVGLGHTGIKGTERAWAADMIIANTEGLIAYLDGHSHETNTLTFKDKNGNDVFYQQVGTKYKQNGESAIKNLGEMVINFEGEKPTVTGRIIDVASLEAVDENVKAIVDEVATEIETAYGEVVGHTNFLLSILDEEGKRLVRKHETNMGDLNADAYRILGNSQIALVNGGGVRADIEPGDITRKQLAAVNPFGNQVATFRIKGSQILDALEHAYRNLPDGENGGFFQVSGLEVVVNTHYPTPVIVDEKGAFGSIDPNIPRRVISCKVEGVEMDPEATYTVTGTTYILQQAGDGYTMFGDPEVVEIYDEPDSEFTERYVVEKLGGEIPAEYEGIRGQGRIKFVDQEDPIRSFVTRLYDKCLEREPDAEGLTDWSNKLANKEITAADAVSGFFNSTEMKNLNLSDDEFVERCYQTMLNRKADANGKKYWMDKLAKGMSRDYVLKHFVQSNEFGNICAEYGVEKGAIEAPEARDQNEGITEFVARCYDKVLGRKYDVAGLNYWCEKILSEADKKAAAGDAASKGFFTSNEYVAKNASDEDFIKTCYRTFLDREAEAQGLAFWKKEIAKGRDHVLKGFASSNEFAKIMARYGIQ